MNKNGIDGVFVCCGTPLALRTALEKNNKFLAVR